MKRELKVGIFVLVGLLSVSLVVFLVGGERGLFEKRAGYHSLFADVDGLKAGAPVVMEGLNVGSVERIGYSSDPNDQRLRVDLSLYDRVLPRVHEGLTASIGSKGLLGDKVILLQTGDPKKPLLPEGSAIPTRKEPGLDQMMETVTRIGNRADAVLGNIQKTTETFADDTMRQDVAASVRSLKNILGQIESGKGYIGRLLSDPKEAENLSATVANLRDTSEALQSTLQRTDHILARVEQGPGLLHEVLYGEETSQTVRHFSRVAEELAATLEGIRKNESVAHTLVYGGDGTEALLANLNAASGDLRAITADVRAGKGTVGALLKDPSVYEDLKLILGNVSRNRVLRSLVRYSIEADEQQASPSVQSPATP